MSNWQSVCIGDIANIPKKRPVANPQAIELLTVRLYAKGIERTGKYPRATERGRPYFAREAGEILIGRQNFHNGGIGIVGKADHGLICSNAITSLIPTDRADKDFLFYLLSNSEFRNSIQKQSEGTGQSEISETKILSLELALPPLPEQKKIAEILSGIDSLAQRVKSKIAKLEHAKNALIQNLYKEDSEQWKAVGEITDFVTSGSRGWSQYYSSKGARFVRIGNLSRNSINLDPTPEKWQLVDPPEGAEGARTKLEEGDLLISITADLGICCVYSESIGEAYINQHIALVRLASDYGAHARQIAYYICSEHCQEQIRSMNDSGAKAGLNLDSIRRIRVPLIQDDESNQVVQSIDALQSAISSNLVRLHHLKYEKNSLSSDLLLGRKRVSI